jgi:hypothetical protein
MLVIMRNIREQIRKGIEEIENQRKFERGRRINSEKEEKKRLQDEQQRSLDLLHSSGAISTLREIKKEIWIFRRPKIAVFTNIGTSYSDTEPSYVTAVWGEAHANLTWDHSKSTIGGKISRRISVDAQPDFLYIDATGFKPQDRYLRGRHIDAEAFRITTISREELSNDANKGLIEETLVKAYLSASENK